MIAIAKESLTREAPLPGLRLLIGLLLAVLLAQSSASLTWKIVKVYSEPEANLTLGKQVEKSRLFRKKTSATRTSARPEELPLFGKAIPVEKTDRPLPVESTDAPVTTLALILKGVITVEPMQRALAVIAEKKNEEDENLYSIGDKVPGNALISEIYPDRVILRRGGVLETLMMQDDEETPLKKSGKAQTPANYDEAVIDLGDGVHWEIDDSYLEERLNDIPSLAREVGVEVYKEEDVQKGYRLVSARGSRLLRELGLQPGDILHEVNGIKLDTIQGGLSAYQQIRNSNEIRVVISRNGRRETRIYEVNNGG